MNDYERQWKPILNHDRIATKKFIKTCLPQTRAYLKRRGCTDDQEAEDVFMESFYIMLKNAVNGKCRFDSPPSKYLKGIVRIHWLVKWREKNKGASLAERIKFVLYCWIEDLLEEMNNNDPDEEIGPVKIALRTAFGQLKEDCQTLLSLLYYEKRSYTEIATLRDTTETFITTKLARCRKYLKSLAQKILKP
jgi:RNA polymerase sigma factor (sigma-70 family)